MRSLMVHKLWTITYVQCKRNKTRRVSFRSHCSTVTVPTLKNPLADKSREVTLRSISIHWLIDSLNIVNDDVMIEKL